MSDRPPAAPASDPSAEPVTSTRREPTPLPSDPIVLDDASRRFGDFVAVRSITATVPAGTILGMIGPSGSGKTTTVRMLTGALRPTSGRVRVLREDPASFRRQTRERIGYMPQTFVLYPDLTAEENVSFVGSLFGMLWRRRRRRVREVLQLVDLWGARDRRASKLSGGMQRRLELACALVHEPQVLFLDEPSAGIDPLLRQEIWDELRRLRDAGRTLLVTTQYVGEAEYCDSVALLSEGRLIALDSPEGLRREALGGDVVEVETSHGFDADVLRSVPGVRAINQRSPRDAFVIVDDAGTATPAIVERASAEGVDVTSSREFRPPFDEVFAELVTRDAAAVGTGDARGPSGPSGPTDGSAPEDGGATQADATPADATPADATPADATQADATQADDEQVETRR